MAFAPIGGNYAASGLINKYSESPILPQLKDRYVMGAKSDRKSTGDLHIYSATNSSKSSSESKRRSLLNRGSFMMSTSAAAEKMVSDAARGHDKAVELPSPPESGSNASVVARFPPFLQAARPTSDASTKSRESDHTASTTQSRSNAFSATHKPSSSEVTIEMGPAKTTRKSRPEIKNTAFVDLSYQGVKPAKSFTIRSIDLLIKDNPTIEIELNLLKKTIQEHENDIEHAKTAVEVEMHRKLWEAFLKMEKLEKRLEGKTSIVNDCYNKLDEYEEKLDKAEGLLNDAKQRIRDLENEVQKKDMSLDLQRREQSSTVIRLEREKRGLVDQLANLEQKMDVAKIKAETSVKTKEIALRHNEGMKKHYSFYREYYNKQDALYKSYFGKSGDSRDTEIKVIEESTPLRFSAFCEDAVSPASVKDATETLRSKYRGLLAGDNLETLRGFEFLAWLENGFDPDASVVESLDMSMLAAVEDEAEAGVLETAELEANNILEKVEDDGEGSETSVA